MSQMVNKIKSTNTTGTDNISSKLVKDQSYLLIPILTHIFNLCIQKNVYPNNLKIMKIIPVLKPDKDSLDPTSYRDINLSNIFAKIVDRIIYNQMMEFLESNKIFPNTHIGGLPGMSTSDAIEKIHDKLQKSNSQSTPSCFISIDQKSAFTMIQHSILLKKLDHIGFSYNSVVFMRSYLINRSQSTYFNGTYSSISDIGDYGCFQGLITSSLLYILYVLDQPMIAHIACDHEKEYDSIDECEEMFSINYIDDNMTEITTGNWDDIIDKTEIYLKNQQTYHEDNLLSFNHEKTVLLVNSKKKKYRKKKANFNDKVIEHTEKLKSLV